MKCPCGNKIIHWKTKQCKECIKKNIFTNKKQEQKHLQKTIRETKRIQGLGEHLPTTKNKKKGNIIIHKKKYEKATPFKKENVEEEYKEALNRNLEITGQITLLDIPHYELLKKKHTQQYGKYKR